MRSWLWVSVRLPKRKISGKGISPRLGPVGVAHSLDDVCPLQACVSCLSLSWSQRNDFQDTWSWECPFTTRPIGRANMERVFGWELEKRIGQPKRSEHATWDERAGRGLLKAWDSNICKSSSHLGTLLPWVGSECSLYSSPSAEWI